MVLHNFGKELHNSHIPRGKRGKGEGEKAAAAVAAAVAAAAVAGALEAA